MRSCPFAESSNEPRFSVFYLAKANSHSLKFKNQNMKFLIYFLALLGLASCANQEITNERPRENFIVNRVLITNDKDEMLMIREENVWAPPSFLYNKRQFVKEGIDSLANAHGIKITSPKLHGHFSFKYDYEPYATIRNIYTAQYVSGKVKVPKHLKEVVWLPIEEAIEKNTITAIKLMSDQIIKNPDVVWGGSFMVSHVGDDHPTKQVEGFYPLFD